jgi:hypothetical protein
MRPVTLNGVFNLVAGAPLPGQLIKSDVPFIFRQMMAISLVGANYACQLSLDGRPMSRERIRRDNLFGIATFPAKLTAYGYVRKGGQIGLDFLSLGANDTVYVLFDGLTGTPDELKKLTENYRHFPFFYNNDTILGAAGGGADENTGLIVAEADHDFKAVQLIAEASVSLDFLSEIKIGGDSITRGKVHARTIYGSAQLPTRIEPQLVKTDSNIEIISRNLSPAPNTVRVTLGGYKIDK